MTRDRRSAAPLRRAPFLAAALAALLSPAAAAADPAARPCPRPGLAVVSADDDVQDRLCALAAEVVSSLSACHLPQRRDLEIAAVETVLHPFGTCLGACDDAGARVRIVVRDSYEALVEPGDPYAAMPARDVLRALLFHEIAHALIEQNTTDRAVPLVDHEYIAAAMEIEHMTPDQRRAMLDFARLDTPAEGRINIWSYRLEPRRFAANAWLHFRLDGHGCDLVGRLVAGEATFDVPER